jgi:hypothetical protein
MFNYITALCDIENSAKVFFLMIVISLVTEPAAFIYRYDKLDWY